LPRQARHRRVRSAGHVLSGGRDGGDGRAAEVVFNAVNNVREIDEMSDEQLQAAFSDMAYYCGTYFATQMRKHAG
jgi:hypothetical protein